METSCLFLKYNFKRGKCNECPVFNVVWIGGRILVSSITLKMRILFICKFAFCSPVQERIPEFSSVFPLGSWNAYSHTRIQFRFWTLGTTSFAEFFVNTTDRETDETRHDGVHPRQEYHWEFQTSQTTAWDPVLNIEQNKIIKNNGAIFCIIINISTNHFNLTHMYRLQFLKHKGIRN